MWEAERGLSVGLTAESSEPAGRQRYEELGGRWMPGGTPALLMVA